MQIREMILSDYDDIYALWTNTESIGLRSLDDSKKGISAFLKRNPSTNFVAIDNNKIVGAILCGHDGRRGYIYHTVVEFDYRNRGIATQLIDFAISALQKENITRVCLNVMESNNNGQQFWTHRGWEKKDFLGFYSKSITDKENKPLFKLSVKNGSKE